MDSLRRLGVDTIDLYQVHWPDPLVPMEDTAGEMSRLIEEGKVIAVGVSNHSPEEMDAFGKAVRLSTAQPPYNLFERGIEKEILPYCINKGIALLTYGALCRGLLSGRMKPDTRFVGDDLRKWDPKFREPGFGHYLEAVSRIKKHTSELQSHCFPAHHIFYCSLVSTGSCQISVRMCRFIGLS